jgi:hypothetical protein
VIAESPVVDIAHIIQLAVAPVFMLSGIGAMLAVLTNRLARAVDRARKLEDLLAASAPPDDRLTAAATPGTAPAATAPNAATPKARLQAARERRRVACAERELALLSRRARLIGWATGLCTLTALLISLVIAILFLGAFLTFDAALAVALLFIAAMLCFIGSLLAFLREALLATANLRFGRRDDDGPSEPSHGTDTDTDRQSRPL